MITDEINAALSADRGLETITSDVRRLLIKLESSLDCEPGINWISVQTIVAQIDDLAKRGHHRTHTISKTIELRHLCPQRTE